MRTLGLEYTAPGETAFCDLGEPPDVQPTEILIATRYSGITNGTERHALLGEHGWGQYPSRHGYQHVGEVVAAGEAVEGFSVGDWCSTGATSGIAAGMWWTSVLARRRPART